MSQRTCDKIFIYSGSTSIFLFSLGLHFSVLFGRRELAFGTDFLYWQNNCELSKGFSCPSSCASSFSFCHFIISGIWRGRGERLNNFFLSTKIDKFLQIFINTDKIWRIYRCLWSHVYYFPIIIDDLLILTGKFWSPIRLYIS